MIAGLKFFSRRYFDSGSSKVITEEASKISALLSLGGPIFGYAADVVEKNKSIFICYSFSFLYAN